MQLMVSIMFMRTYTTILAIYPNVKKDDHSYFNLETLIQRVTNSFQLVQEGKHLSFGIDIAESDKPYLHMLYGAADRF